LILNPDGSVRCKPGTPAGTYTFVYEICTKNTPVVCDQATVTVSVTCNTTKISGVVRDLLNNRPLANVPVTLIPDKQTTGSVLLMLTKADGSYNFTGFTPGDYIIQVQDVNLNSAQNLYNVGPSIQFLNIQNCIYEVRNFDYDKTDLPVLGNFVWYDINSNGLQDEWYDANNDGVVTQIYQMQTVILTIANGNGLTIMEMENILEKRTKAKSMQLVLEMELLMYQIYISQVLMVSLDKSR